MAAPSFTNVEVRPDGWTLSSTIVDAKDGGSYSGLNDKDTPGFALTVRSRSWGADLIETTLDRTVYARKVLRKPYPDEASLEETEDGSDLGIILTGNARIYDDDTIVSAAALDAFYTDDGAGGSTLANSAQSFSVTNNSTFTYRKPKAVCLNKPLERVTAGSYDFMLLVIHRHAMNGQPVRAVRATATDESATSIQGTATALTATAFTLNGLYANYYKVTFDLTQLADGELVTFDTEIFPWIGDKFTVSTDGESYPSPNLTVHKILNDSGGGNDTIIAYVDDVSGNDGTGVASETDGTASASPFLTPDAAYVALQNYNNSHNGRNNLDGCVLRIPAGINIDTIGGALDARTFGKGEFLIEGMDRATSIINDGGAHSPSNITGAVRFRNLTLQKTGNYIFLYGKNTMANQIVFDDVSFDLTTGAAYAGWFYQVGREYFFGCDGDDCGQGRAFSTNVQGAALIAGSDFDIITGMAVYNIVSCSGAIAQGFLGGSSATNGLGLLKGGVFAFNDLTHPVASGLAGLRTYDTDLGERGIGIACNKIISDGTTQEALGITADNQTTANVNIDVQMNTTPVSRANFGYNETGTAAILKDASLRQNAFNEINIKSDIFGTSNGNRTGNWALRNGVDNDYNFIAAYDSAASTDYGPSTWLGDIGGEGDVPAGTPDYDGSHAPGASTDIPQVPAGLTMWKTDLYGTSIPTAGTAYAGAVQPAASATFQPAWARNANVMIGATP